MALVVRIDVDRPYGREPMHRHVLSRLSSDFWLPRLDTFAYLAELVTMLRLLNERTAHAYVFFRHCTRPSVEVLDLVDSGGHEIGLHLENSRSYQTFRREKTWLEDYVGRPIRAVSKHGSGRAKFGFHHYAPYEPEYYVNWAKQEGMRLFLGNLEDPTLLPLAEPSGFISFPSAFWLEPFWRDTGRFDENWLLQNAASRDVVLLVHPENVLASPDLTASFCRLVGNLETKILN